MNQKELLEIIDDEERNFEWGGDESEDGTLQRGDVNFERIRKAIKDFLKENKIQVPRDKVNQKWMKEDKLFLNT